MSSALPTKMRALLLNGKDIPQDLSLSSTSVPSPGPKDVLIRVHAAALNPIDIKRATFIPDTFPVVFGYDVAGVVVARGAEVSHLSVGDRVFGDILADSLGLKVTGSIAEYCVAPEHTVVPLPANMSFAQGAAVPLAAQTAVQAFKILGCKKGDKVFLSAGAGGVGIHAIQIAKNLFGASQVATTASSAKIDFVKQYGADIVVDYRKEDAGEKLQGWADVVLDCVGDMEMANKVKSESGKMTTIVDVSDPAFFGLLPSRDQMESIAALMAEGKLIPVLDSVHPLEDAIKAVKLLEAGRAKGKIVIKVIE